MWPQPSPLVLLWYTCVKGFLTHQFNISENIKKIKRIQRWNNDEDSTARNNWNAEAKENQQLDSGGSDQRKSIRPTYLKALAAVVFKTLSGFPNDRSNFLPRRLLCCSSYLLMCLWFHMWCLFCPYLFLFCPSLVPREGRASWQWHFLGIFTCTFAVSLLKTLLNLFNSFWSGDPKRVFGKQCRTRRLIRVFTVCTYFSHFSLGISKYHSLTYLKLKFDSSNT